MVHLDQAGPLRSDRDGSVLVDGPWGIYFRMGRTGTGITGGGLPVFLDRPAARPLRAGQPRARRRAGVRGLLRVGAGDRAAALPRPRRRLARDRRRRPPHPHPGQLPGLRLGAAGRVRDRGLGPRLQDARDRQARGRGPRRRRAAARAVPARPLRSRATCTRPRRARTRGPETRRHGTQAAQAHASATGSSPARSSRDRRSRSPASAARSASWPTGSAWRCEHVRPQLGHRPDPGRAVRARSAASAFATACCRWRSASDRPARHRLHADRQLARACSSSCPWRSCSGSSSSGPFHRKRYRAAIADLPRWELRAE